MRGGAQLQKWCWFFVAAALVQDVLVPEARRAEEPRFFARKLFGPCAWQATLWADISGLILGLCAVGLSAMWPA